jgi:nucleoid DNA-binding protein
MTTRTEVVVDERDAIKKKQIKHSELLAATRARAGKQKYPMCAVQAIVNSYLDTVLHALGTCRRVQFWGVGYLVIKVRKPLCRHIAKVKNVEKFQVEPRLKFHARGAGIVRRAVEEMNHVVHTKADEPKIKVVSKRWKL